MKVLNSIIIFMFALVPLYGGNGSEIIYKTSREYQVNEFSAIESGRNLSSNQHAITRREFRYRVLNSDVENKDGFTSYFNGEVTPFVAGFHSPYTGSEDSMSTQLIYLYNKIPDVINLSFGAGIDDYFYGKMVLGVSGSRTSFSGGEGEYHPLMGEYYSSGDSPKEGYLSFSAKHISLTIGRFKGGVGHGLMGNLFQNSHAPYYDQLQFSFYSKSIKYYYMLGSSSYKLTDDEEEYMENQVDFEYENIKTFAFHRLELSFIDKVTLGVGEMTLIGGKVPDYYMVNPFGVYHNTYEDRYFSYYFQADISFVPAKRHMIFFEALSNEIHVEGESNSDPTALGFQLGYWYILPFKTETKHRIAFEATHVDTWTYSDTNPYITMYQRQILRETNIDVPLGYSHGGDCEQFSLIYTAVSKNGLKLDFTLSRLHKGEVNFQLKENGKMPYLSASRYQGRPSGTVEMWSTVEVSSLIPITNTVSLNIFGNYSYIENFKHEDGNDTYLAILSAGLTFKF